MMGMKMIIMIIVINGNHIYRVYEQILIHHISQNINNPPPPTIINFQENTQSVFLCFIYHASR